MRLIRAVAAFGALAALGIPIAAAAHDTPPRPERDASQQDSSGEFRVSNLVFGPICDPGEGGAGEAIGVDGAGEICEGSKIAVRGRGRCVFAGEEKPCTWFGFEFDYANKDPDEPITCTWTRSAPVNDGNVEEVVKRRTTTNTVTLDTGPETSGRHRHTMYQVYAPFPAPWYIVRMDIRCTYRGKQVLETDWQLIFSSEFR